MISDKEKAQIITATQADDGFMREFVDDFLRDVAQDILALEQALLEKDRHNLERLAHSLKSVVGFFKATTSYETAKELEATGREGNFEEAARKLTALKTALAELKELLVAMP